MKNKTLMAAVLLIITTTRVMAITYPFPIVTSVIFDHTNLISKQHVYRFQVATAYVHDDRIANDTTVEKALEILTGLPVTAQLITGETLFNSNDKYAMAMSGWRDYHAISRDQPFIEFMQNWTNVTLDNQNGTKPWTRTADGGVLCVTNRVWTAPRATLFRSMYQSTWGLDTYETCAKAPPTTGRCDLISETIDFNYGALSAGEANGATLEKPVHVQCTTSTKYKLNVLGGPNISLDNGMTANIMTDGIEAGETLNNAVTGDNTVTLRATLRGTPAKTGAFAGSGIMVVSYP